MATSANASSSRPGYLLAKAIEGADVMDAPSWASLLRTMYSQTRFRATALFGKSSWSNYHLTVRFPVL